MSAEIQRLFWGWKAPVLDQAVELLCRDWDSARALDLSSTLLLVPNGEAGRRLREALAVVTNETGTAAIVPHLWLPEQALLPQTRRFEAATAVQSQMAWQRALERVPVDSLAALFPKPPTSPGWGWQAETARMLAELKMLLGTGGLLLRTRQIIRLRSARLRAGRIWRRSSVCISRNLHKPKWRMHRC